MRLIGGRICLKKKEKAYFCFYCSFARKHKITEADTQVSIYNITSTSTQKNTKIKREIHSHKHTNELWNKPYSVHVILYKCILHNLMLSKGRLGACNQSAASTADQCRAVCSLVPDVNKETILSQLINSKCFTSWPVHSREQEKLQQQLTNETFGS